METWTIYKNKFSHYVEYQGEKHAVILPLEPYLKCRTEEEAKAYVKFFYDAKWKHHPSESYVINRHSWDEYTERAYKNGTYKFGAFEGRLNIKL